MREEDVHPVPEPSPVSSPSLNPAKDRNFTGSSLQRCESKGPEECMVEETNVKRQMMLDYTSPEAGNGLTSEAACYSDINAASSHIPTQNSTPTPAQLTPTSQRKGVCGFCHTSNQTVVTGKLLYFANGKEVSEIEMTTASKVTTVHTKCIQWAPQVYFVGDTVKNLDSELARAAKLKCTCCGKKGAALGCFEKSCRSTYHVLCAIDVIGCRWDCENYQVLCPVHTSVEFPSEKSKPRKSAPGHSSGELLIENSKPSSAPTPISQDEISWITLANADPHFWAASPNGPKHWVFCGSALSNEDMFVMVKFANMCGARVSKLWRSNVTHVIASTDEKGACTQTFKVLMGILHGKWILNMGWVKACMEAIKPLNEEPYEISLDNHGRLDGPKTGRLRVSKNEPKLFEGMYFYLIGCTTDLIDLVKTAGGEIVESTDQLITRNVPASTHRIIVYNADTLSQRKAEALNLVIRLNCTVVGLKWILDRIAACVV